MSDVTQPEMARRDEVLQAILDCIRANKAIKLPEFDKKVSIPSRDVAGQTVGLEPNPFGGTVGPYRYQFEGEEDLLHVLITKRDQTALSPEEGQSVMSFLVPELSPALTWLKPGTFTQHFYFGHDELLIGRQP